jgi:A118 family predicted phage portal protein
VDQWAELQPTVTVSDTSGQLFGWYKVAAANCIDVDSPMGVSVYAKARDTIEQADYQYSRLLWEFEGSELAIDVDPTVLRTQNAPAEIGQTRLETPHLSERLFRQVDMGRDDTYKVFSPAIRDASLINGLNHLLAKIEDQCGLSRGTLCDPDAVARTATELKIMKARTYTTIDTNQKALERCLRDVLRVMDRYATLYGLAPEGEYDVSFEWDDSILSDTAQQLQERLLLLNAGLYSKAEMRQWYFGETSAQAQASIAAVQQEQMGLLGGLDGLLPQVMDK